MTEVTMNGHSGERYIDSIDPEDPEYIKQLRRPADIKCDLQRMDSTTRVSNILHTKDFKDELECLVTQLTPGGAPPSLGTMKKITEILTPLNKIPGWTCNSPIPISDVRGQDSLCYCKGEKILRCKTASLFRLVDLNGWSSGINNSITVRISQDLEHFLINPHGLQFHEVTASSLAKVDMQGDMIDAGSTNMGIDKRAFSLHAAVHSFRPDIRCVLYSHSQSAVAVSALKSGLLPVCQEAMIIGDCSYFDYAGIISSKDDSDKLARALGPNNKVLFLRHHGVAVCGESIEEAFLLAQNVSTACDTQVKLIPAGLDNVLIPGDDVRKQTYEAFLSAETTGEDGKRKWRRGEKEFESLMRQLDNMGFRTGHVYHEPVLRADQKVNRINADIEYPPTASSTGYHDDDKPQRESIDDGPLRLTLERQKDNVRTHWLGTPNAYSKQEIDEVGTQNPKKYTKWVAEKDPELKSSTVVKTENPNQFAPQGSDPKELKLKHKAIRKEYYTETIHAGPQSKILDGISWEEAERIKDAHVSGTTDTKVYFGSASKGIILRDHQYDATVYKTYYQPNPFESMSQAEIDRYKNEISKDKDPEIETSVTTINTHVSTDDVGKTVETVETKVEKTVEKVDIPEPVVTQIKTTVHPQKQYLETSLDDPPTGQAKDPKKESTFVRSATLQYTPDRKKALVEDLKNKSHSLERSKSEKKKNHLAVSVNGEDPVSPARSTSSGELSPSKEVVDTPGTDGKKKKKFRIPSFSKKKDKKTTA